MQEDQKNIDFSYEVEANSITEASFFMSESSSYNMYSLGDLERYIKNPMNYNRILRKISREAYNYNGQYGNMINRSVATPTLSYITVSRNKTKKSKQNKQLINLLMKKINHKKTTRDVLRHSFIDGMYVGILRDTKPTNKKVTPQQGSLYSMDGLEGLSMQKNLMIQPLDLDYCKIIGFSNNVNIAAFNMQYFDQFKHSGLLHEIKNFPPEFVSAYREYRKDASKQWFVLDKNKTIAYKFGSNLIEPYGRPYGLQALKDMHFQEDYEGSQQKLIGELASSIYYLVLPQGKEPGSCSLNTNQQKVVIEGFKKAVKINTSGNNAKISTLSLPPGTQLNRLSKDSSLLKDTLSEEIMKKISTNLGFASAALNGVSGTGANYASLQININFILSQIFEMIDDISSEYTRVLNEYLGISENNYIDITYLPISTLNQSEVYTRAKELYTHAGGSKKFLIAAAGFDVDNYLAVCDEENEDNFDEKYPPHPTSFTVSDSADKINPEGNIGGKPKKPDDELTPSGMQTRTNGGNEFKKIT